MLSRAFVKPPPRRSPQPTAVETSLRSTASIFEYEDLIFGFMDDIPLVCFDEYNDSYNKVFSRCNNKTSMINSESTQMTLRQVLRASVGVLGESPLGMTEKVALLGGQICAVKRFRRVAIRKREFGRRMEKVAQVGNQCEYLVPVTAYLYAKRIKFVVCDYYPMGSLADLLSGEREEGHTALEWKHRFKIIICIAKAIAYIHSQTPPREKHLQLNVHGNIKSSNVLVNIDFTAHLSDYGFVQLADQVVVDVDTGQQAAETTTPVVPPERVYSEKLSQKSDIYNFGVVMLDMLDWSEVKKGDLFECCMESRPNQTYRKVLEIALTCTNSLADERPDIEQILDLLSRCRV